MSGFFRSAALEETRASIEERQRTADVALIVLQCFAPGQSRIRDRTQAVQYMYRMQQESADTEFGKILRCCACFPPLGSDFG